MSEIESDGSEYAERMSDSEIVELLDEKDAIIREFITVVNKWRVEPDQLSIMRRLYAPEVVSLLQRAQWAISNE